MILAKGEECAGNAHESKSNAIYVRNVGTFAMTLPGIKIAVALVQTESMTKSEMKCEAVIDVSGLWICRSGLTCHITLAIACYKEMLEEGPSRSKKDYAQK